ncbi:MAG: hypothetical protein ABFR53_13605 [Actinomycetota bacterium]
MGRMMWAVTAGGTSCPICGQDGDIVSIPSRWDRWRGWLVGGHVTGPTLRCAEGHEWTGGSAKRMVLRGHGPPSRLSSPIRAFQVLHRHRTLEPSPLFLMGAAAVGVVIGAVAQMLLGWPWWLVAVLWFLAVWLAFLATAFKGAGRDELRIDLMRAVNPTRAMEMEDEQLVRLVRDAPGAIYGLAGRDGLRSIGGHSRSSSTGLTRLELMYGDPLEGPNLRIESRWRRPDRPDPDLAEERDHLARALWHEQLRPPTGFDREELHRWTIEHRREIDQRPIPEWAPAEFSVDGTMCGAWTYNEGDGWAALIALDDALIGIRANRFPMDGVTIDTVDDIAPYIEGLTFLRDRTRAAPPPIPEDPST